MPLYGISPNNNNNNNKNKIRTNSIGDMPLYGISPNYLLFCKHSEPYGNGALNALYTCTVLLIVMI